MTEKSWLEKQAEEETKRRLYGDRPAPGGWLAKIFWWIAKVLIGVTLLAGLAIAALFALERWGFNRYVLVCPGRVTSPTVDGYADGTLYFGVSEYGTIIRLWNRDIGTANAEIPEVDYMQVTDWLRGTKALMSIYKYDDFVGSYSALSGTIKLTLSDSMYFEGKCSRRRDTYDR